MQPTRRVVTGVLAAALLLILGCPEDAKVQPPKAAPSTTKEPTSPATKAEGKQDQQASPSSPTPASTPAAPPPPAPASLRFGAGVAFLEIGSAIPATEQSQADGRRRWAAGEAFYWGDLGLEAQLDGEQRVKLVLAHGEGSDPFFRSPYEGKSSEGIGPGSSRQELITALGAATSEALKASPFGPDRQHLLYPSKGVGFELDAKTGKVLSVRVMAPVR